MSNFGSLSLGLKLCIVLGCLIALTFVAGGIKLGINKRRLRKNLKIEHAEAAKKTTDREKLVQRQVKEGDLFGVRALEHGYFGGVAQSRPQSPTPSYILAPETPIVDWSKSGNGSLTSSSGSLKDFSRTRNASNTSLPVTPNQARFKPSPLGLSETELDRVRNSPSAIGGMGGAYMPPLPSPRADRSASPMFNEPKPAGWVSPLDVHFSKPIKPQPYRPTSYLPKLNFPWENGSTGLLIPMTSDIQSEAASIVNSEVTVPSPAVLESPRVDSTLAKSPTFPPFPQQQKSSEPRKIPTQLKIAQELKVLQEQQASEDQKILSRAARNSSRSMFPANDDYERRASVRSTKGNPFDVQPVPLEDLPPIVTSIDPNSFPQDSRQWNPATSPTIPRDSIMSRKWTPAPPVRDLKTHWDSPSISESIMKDSWDDSSPIIPDSVLDAEWENANFSKPVIRDSIVSKKRVSVTRPPPVGPDMSSTKRNRIESIAASSMYSMETSILDQESKEEIFARHERMRSQAASIQSYSQNPSRTGSGKRPSPASRSLSRTRDSVRRHNRKVSDEALHNRSRSRSRGRGRTIETEQHDWDRSRSAVDSDHLRKSPFDNSNAMSDHSRSSSISSYISTEEAPEVPPVPASLTRNERNFEQDANPAWREPNRAGGLQTAIQDLSRLSVVKRGRAGSEVSQNSIGSFYDSYFRQSAIGTQPEFPRNSVQSQIQGFNARDSGVLSISDASKINVRDSKRPAPLNLKLGRGNSITGGKYGGHETISELPTPLPTPLNGTGAFGPERLHSRI